MQKYATRGAEGMAPNLPCHRLPLQRVTQGFGDGR
jgi:hypothetical protein